MNATPPTRVIAVLVGNDIDENNVKTAVQSDGSGVAFDNSVTNYVMISNSTNDPAGPQKDIDYFVTDFTNLADQLTQIASFCDS